ncbi:MAG: hypothetical protein LBU12_05660, partial [Deltaproteobacteria bacterium]|nr:hypothetical protein [Deltaproteobacteria bacterium]
EAARAPSPKLASARFGLLSSGLTLTWAEFEEAQRLLEQLTDPLPPAEPSEALLRTPAGRVYAALKNDYEARQELYQGVLAKRLADRAPSVEGLAPWAADRWREMGGEGPPPGLVEGRLSETALLRLMTGQRLASANWHEEILPRLTEAGLLRELAAMEAVRLELDRRRNEHLENLTLMAALSGLSELEAGRGEALRLQRRRATGAAVE